MKFQWNNRSGFLALLLCVGTLRGAQALPLSSADLFKLTNIWSVELKFSAEQWKAMEPKGGGSFPGFGGPRGGPGPMAGGRPPGGPGAGPGGPGGPGGFSPAMFIAPLFMRDGDADHDGKLSRAEFSALGEKWFAGWDTNKSGQVSAAELPGRMNSLFAPPGAMGGGPGPGGGGGPGRGGFRMNLQGPEGQRNGVAAMMGVQFEYVHADLKFEGAEFANVAARYKGNGTYLESRGSEKRSMKVDLNKFNKAHQVANVNTLNFHNNVTDPSYMNEPLAYQLYRDAGVAAPRSAYAKVRVTVDGEKQDQYLGLYSMVENVDKGFLQANFKTKGGALFKPVTPDLFSFLGDDWVKYKQTFDAKDEPSPAEIARVIETCRFVTDATDEQFAARVGEFFELDSLAAYLAVTVWLVDLDGILGPGQNFYLHLHPQTKKFTFIPWDQDHSFGQMRGSQVEREQLSIHKPWTGENRFLERLFKVEDFKKRYLAKFEEFSKTIFAPERFQRQVDALAAVIRPAVVEEGEAKVKRFDDAVAGKIPEGGGFAAMFGGAKPIKTFALARTESVREQVAGKSEGRVIGNMGFGPGPGPGPGPRGGGPGGPGGPGGGGFGPGTFLANPFMEALDGNKDKTLTKAETAEGFAKLFEEWSGKSDSLSGEQLNAGINKDLNPMRGMQMPFGGPPPQ